MRRDAVLPSRGGFRYAVAAGILCALVASFAGSPHAFADLRFHLGLYDRSGETKSVESTLRLFNKLFASFFNTGGLIEGLNEFPAANLVKRRIFQDIGELAKTNTVIVYDRDVFKLRKVDFLDPVRAVALADEVWFISLQDSRTRKPISAVKANPIRVRYLLRKEKGAWRVVEYEVFDKSGPIPPLGVREF